jgi:hypothetical protein
MLEPGWRKVVEEMWTPGTGRLRYKQDWGGDHIFYAEKIHARNSYDWRYPIHEYIIPITPEKIVRYDGVLIRHEPDTGKSRGQYLPLLEKATKENPPATAWRTIMLESFSTTTSGKLASMRPSGIWTCRPPTGGTSGCT